MAGSTHREIKYKQRHTCSKAHCKGGVLSLILRCYAFARRRPVVNYAAPGFFRRRQKLFAVLKGRILYGGGTVHLSCYAFATICLVLTQSMLLPGDRDDGTTWDEEIVGVSNPLSSDEFTQPCPVL